MKVDRAIGANLGANLKARCVTGLPARRLGRDGVNPWVGASPTVRNHICAVCTERCVDVGLAPSRPSRSLVASSPPAPLGSRLWGWPRLPFYEKCVGERHAKCEKVVPYCDILLRAKVYHFFRRNSLDYSLTDISLSYNICILSLLQNSIQSEDKCVQK